MMRMSKLLLVMKKDGGNQYQGKSLDEVNINMERICLARMTKVILRTLLKKTCPKPRVLSLQILPLLFSQSQFPRTTTFIPWTSKQNVVERVFQETLNYLLSVRNVNNLRNYTDKGWHTQEETIFSSSGAYTSSTSGCQTNVKEW